MGLPLITLVVLTVAAPCGFLVYQNSNTRSLLRGLLTLGILFLTPFLVFSLFAAVLTSDLPGLVAVLPIVLLGVGLYIIAEGALPVAFNTYRNGSD